MGTFVFPISVECSIHLTVVSPHDHISALSSEVLIFDCVKTSAILLSRDSDFHSEQHQKLSPGPAGELAAGLGEEPLKRSGGGGEGKGKRRQRREEKEGEFKPLP